VADDSVDDVVCDAVWSAVLLLDDAVEADGVVDPDGAVDVEGADVAEGPVAVDVVEGAGSSVTELACELADVPVD